VVAPPVVAPAAAPPLVAAPVVAAPLVPDTGCAMPCVDCRESVMANRWSVGLSVGSMSLAPDSTPDATTQFAVGELALRFRATPHLELELSAGGGREQTAEGKDGDLEVNTAALVARYRFRPEAAWNWFLMGGVGGVSVTRHDATQQERSDATRPLGMFGIGVERRFRHFAVQAELRGFGLGKRTQDPAMAVPAQPAEMTTTSASPTADIQRSKGSGASLSIGLSYYF
jgi:opacity protein-like surface antigen